MKQINAYLSFDGNCREAMNFYKECLGGELYLMTISESPMAARLPAQVQDNVMHATLTNGNTVIMGSDMGSETGVTRGNAVALMIECESEEEIREFYEVLARGGKATHPLENTFWGAIFGGLTDKFGTLWLLNYAKNA